MTLKELGEFGLIHRIVPRSGSGRGVTLGIGDDAAAVIPTPGLETLITADMLVEGVHFDLTLTTPLELGAKSLAVNLSDIAAMGAVPRFTLLSLAIPPTFSLELLDPFLDGFTSMAQRHGVTLVGGDTCSSRAGFVISVTLMGEQRSDRIIRRSGAIPGDRIYVTGTVGDSALGLTLLRRGERNGGAIIRHLAPLPRNEAGQLLAEGGMATAMIDISDGLAADLGHILTQSGRGATLFLDRLPLSQEYRDRVPALADDLFALALSGGEDYELLFTAPADRQEEIRSLSAAVGLPMTDIGEITAASGLLFLSPDGSPYTPTSRGFDHFS